MFEVYTDGSFKDGKIGWAYVILDEDRLVVEKNSGCSTNEELCAMRNVGAELLAAANAIKVLRRKYGALHIILHSDYEGVQMWPDGGWKTKKPATARFAKFVNDHREHCRIQLMWVKGHSGDQYNEMADTLAGRAALAG